MEFGEEKHEIDLIDAIKIGETTVCKCMFQGSDKHLISEN